MILEEYRKLRDELNYQTGHISSHARTIRHPTYQKIVDLGKDVIPIILDEFDHYIQTGEQEEFPGHWAFSVLCTLLGVEPRKDARPGVLDDWVKIWVEWGEESGYLAKGRPKYQKKPPVIYKGWIVAAKLDKDWGVSVLCPKRKPKNLFEETHGTGAWVSKKSAASCDDKDWWKKYAWVFPTKEEADIALEILNEKVKNGECGKSFVPRKAWVEEI